MDGSFQLLWVNNKKQAGCTDGESVVSFAAKHQAAFRGAGPHGVPGSHVPERPLPRVPPGVRCRRRGGCGRLAVVGAGVSRMTRTTRTGSLCLGARRPLPVLCGEGPVRSPAQFLAGLSGCLLRGAKSPFCILGDGPSSDASLANVFSQSAARLLALGAASQRPAVSNSHAAQLASFLLHGS